MNEYIVEYWFGKNLEKVHVEAHDEEQAKTIARIQTQSTSNSRAKFEVVSVYLESEGDPFLKDLGKHCFEIKTKP